jgi:hypothetical protein
MSRGCTTFDAAGLRPRATLGRRASLIVAALVVVQQKLARGAAS